MPWPSGSCRHLDCGSDRIRAVGYPEYLLVINRWKERCAPTVPPRTRSRRKVKSKLRVYSYSGWVGLTLVHAQSTTASSNCHAAGHGPSRATGT
jgi:hypothetical protein